MALEVAGVRLEAAGASAFTREIDSAGQSVKGLGVTSETSSRGIGSLGHALGGIGKVVAGAGLAVATAGVVAFGAALTSGIADARAAAITMAQTEAVIASTGGAAGLTATQVADYAASLSAASGKSLFGDDQIQESSNLLLTFTNIKGGALEAATAMSVDMAQAMGGAPKDAAIQLGKALNDPIAGVGALSRVGVTFTEEQKGVIATMVETGDVAGAQGVILAELSKEFGGSAAAAAAADGGMAQLKDRMGEMAESMGAQVLPLLNQFVGFLNSPEVMGAIEQGLGAGMTFLTGTAIPAIQVGFGWLTGTGLPALQTGFQVVWPVIQAAVATAYTFITGTVIPGIRTAFNWITSTGLPAVQGAFNSTWPLVKAAVGVAYDFLHGTVWPFYRAQFAWLIDTGLPAVRGAFQAVWPAVKTAVEGAYTFLSGTVWPWLKGTAFPWLTGTGLPAIQSAFTTVWPIAKGAVESAYTFLSGTVWPWLRATAFPWITDVGLPAVRSAFTTVWPIIKGAVEGPYTFLSGTVWPWLRNTAFPWIINTGLPAVQGAFKTVWPSIQDAVQTVFSFLKDTVWPWLHNTAFPWVIGTGLPAVKRAFETTWPEIQAAVKTVYSFMKDTAWPWLQTAFTNVITWVNNVRTRWDTDLAAMRGFIQDLRDKWDTAVAGVKIAIDLAKGYVEDLRSTVQTKIGEVKTLFTNLPGNITTALGSLATLLVQAGKDVIQGLINGAQSMVGSIGTALSGIVTGAVDAAKAAIGIKSPSTMAYNELGVPMVQGIKQGAEAEAPNLFAAMRQITSSAIGAAKNELNIINPGSRRFFDEVGVPIIIGATAGIDAQGPAMVGAAAAWANAAAEAANDVVLHAPVGGYRPIGAGGGDWQTGYTDPNDPRIPTGPHTAGVTPNVPAPEWMTGYAPDDPRIPTAPNVGTGPNAPYLPDLSGGRTDLNYGGIPTAPVTDGSRPNYSMSSNTRISPPASASQIASQAVINNINAPTTNYNFAPSVSPQDYTSLRNYVQLNQMLTG